MDPMRPVNPITAAAGLVISDVEPSSVLYGTRELTITVLGSGFSADSMIEFAGTTYTPSVNHEGTRLEATVATRDLTMGRYAITVTSGSGVKTTLKKALDFSGFMTKQNPVWQGSL